MKDTIADLTTICQGYKTIIDEQNKTMSKMLDDFQQQVSQITSGFQNQLADMTPNAFRGVYNVQQPQYIVQTPQQFPMAYPQYSPMAVNEYYSDDDSYEERRVRIVRRSDSRRRHRV